MEHDGLPWCTDWLDSRDGTPVYAIRGTLMGKLAWGNIVSYEVNEDTEKAAAFSAYPEVRGL